LRLLVENRLERRAVAVLTRAALDTRHAFDGVAAGYDRSNTENQLLQAMRERTRSVLTRGVAAGSHVLDLGCGPGTDAVHFGARGYRVTAIDASAAMVDEARRRVERAAATDRVRVLQLGIEDLDLDLDLAETDCGPFDAAYSSFGPLNCVADLDAAALGIARRLRPNAVLIASVIGRLCPWEIALYAARGDWRRASVRFARRAVAVPLEGRTVWTRYYTPAAFARAFVRAGFRRESTTALALFTPPPYLHGFASRHPVLIERLQRLDDAVGGWPLARSAGDHFLMVLRKRR
jgi:SAM-dependent methyltransferase